MSRSSSPSPRSSFSHSEIEANLTDSDSEEFSRSGAQTPIFAPMNDDMPPELFHHDIERTRQAEHLLTKFLELTRTTLETEQKTAEQTVSKYIQIRNACLANIKSCRESVYITGLAAKLEAHEKLTAAEYMMYALVTDNVNTLDLDSLKEIPNQINNEFNKHIQILIAVREWQIATGMEAKSQAAAKLRELLKERSYDTFLNLAGVNLSGANLQFTNFSYTNLEKADLSHTQLDGTEFHFCCLDNANLSYINHPSTRNATPAPEIRFSSAKHACLDGMYASKASWEYSDFTGSSLKKVLIQSGHFKNALFDQTDLDGSKIKIADLPAKSFCSFKGANLANATLIASDFKHIDISEARLIAVNDFASALDIIEERTLKLSVATEQDRENLPAKIRHRQNIVAENIIHHLNQLGLSNEHLQEFLEIAIGHTMFQPQSVLEQIANEADRAYHSVESTLFGRHRHHDVYRTKAVEILETAWARTANQNEHVVANTI